MSCRLRNSSWNVILFVVFRLIGKVPFNLFDVRLANREDSVSTLPTEPL